MKKFLLSLLLTIICSAVYSQHDTTGTAFTKRMQVMYNELATPWYNPTAIEIPGSVITPVNPVTNQSAITYPVLTPVATGNNSRSGIHQTIIFNSQGNTRLVTIIRL